jgi:hypothetical protein
MSEDGGSDTEELAARGARTRLTARESVKAVTGAEATRKNVSKFCP